MTVHSSCEKVIEINKQRVEKNFKYKEKKKKK